MREAFRPYTIVKELTDGPVTSVDLVDTAGNSLDCNYVVVESLDAGAGTTKDFFHVQVSSLSVTNQTHFHASGLSGHASGVVGGVGSIHSGSVVIAVQPGDYFNSIQISHNHTNQTPFGITYGVVGVVNPISDSQKPVGS